MRPAKLRKWQPRATRDIAQQFIYSSAKGAVSLSSLSALNISAATFGRRSAASLPVCMQFLAHQILPSLAFSNQRKLIPAHQYFCR